MKIIDRPRFRESLENRGLSLIIYASRHTIEFKQPLLTIPITIARPAVQSSGLSADMTSCLLQTCPRWRINAIR